MILNIDRKRQYMTSNEDGLISIAPLYKSPYNALCIEKGYFGQHIGEFSFIISQDELNNFFETVEDFNTIEYKKENKNFTVYKTTYKRKDYDYYITVSLDLNPEYSEDDFIYEDGKYRVQWLYYDNTQLDLNELVKDLNNVIIEDDNHHSKISVVLKTATGFDFKEQVIEPYEVDIELMYNDDYINIHNHIVDNLTNGKKGLVLFHGIPGSGKTSLIKYLTTLIPKKRFVFIPSSMIPYLTDPSFLSKLIDNKGSILVLEDCETYIKDRETNGDNGVVSTILNVGDGILSDILEMQIICTFNTHIENIDKALTREGRLIAEYYFDKLSEDKVKKLSEEYSIDIENIKEMPLSEIFNQNSNEFRKEENHKQIGFSR